MKRSTIATTALALAASVFAGSSFASSVTVTNVFEDFRATLDLANANGQTRNNLTWKNSGNDNESAVNTTTQKLDIDTGDGLVTATLTTNDVTVALEANETATFSAKVSFYPSSVDVTPTGSDLRFALYAKASGSQTNLIAYAKDNGTASQINTGISIPDTGEKLVAVRIVGTSFYVAVNGGQEAGPYDFITTATGIKKVEFQGNGTVDDVTLAYTSTLAENAHIDIGNTGSASHTLTDNEADYLNNLVAKEGKAAVADKLASVTEADFEQASLLNQDITKSDAASATFSITDIKRSGTDVYVSVKLVRNGDILGGVNGTVALYTCDTPNGEYTQQATFTAALESDASTAEATNKFTGVSKSFFQVKIVDPKDVSSGLPEGTTPSNE